MCGSVEEKYYATELEQATASPADRRFPFSLLEGLSPVMFRHVLLPLTLCLLGIQVGQVVSEKILMIPSPQYSVCQALVSIADDLMLKGHDVTVYQLQGFHALCPGENRTKLITYKPTGLDLRKAMTNSHNFIKSVMSKPPWEKSFWGFLDLIQHQENICRFALGDEDAFQKIKEGNFDFVLIDGAVYNSCYAVIPYVLKIPFGIFGDVLLHWPGRQSFRPHAEPDVISPVSDLMSPFDMAANGLVTFLKYVYTIYEVPMHHVKRVAPELSRKQTVDLLFSAQLYLENDDSVLGYAHPRPPNSILIGGIMTKPAKPLPADIEQFLNKATEGAILIAFGGSTFSHFPEELDEVFNKALSEVNMPVIWKHDVDRTDGLIMKKPWLPVNDILAHPNTRLFIYHCGKNGVYEALYHGVPVLCLPLIYDCVQAAARVTRRGVGKTVELHSLTSDKLRDAINDLISNEMYESNTKKYSKIFHSLQQNPREKAAYWVDHVIKYGAVHLQSSDKGHWAFAEFVMVSVAVMFALVFPVLLIFFCLFALKSKIFNTTKRNTKLD